MSNLLPIIIAGVLYLVSASVFTVNEWEQAIKFRLGEMVASDYEPGLHFKTPFINNVKTFDARIQTLDSAPEQFLTIEKKNLQVDSFVKWRIADVETFYISVSGDYAQANTRLSQIIKDGLRAEFGSRTVQEVISGERAMIMENMAKTAKEEAKQFGIEVVDVRIKRVDLPKEVSDSVYRRMEAERTRVAKEFRSEGAERAEEIRADADKQKTVILAKAYEEAEKVRGEGDALAAATYAASYGKDPEFYRFYRSINAYTNTFASPEDVLVLDPGSDFFQYFEQRN